MKAFVEVHVEVGLAETVLESLRGVEGVKEAYAVTGHCDIVASVEVADFKALCDLVIRKIHAIKGVSRTETLVCMEW